MLRIMSRRQRKRETGISYLVSALQRRGVKLLAVDFDQTLITIHSGGVWKGNVKKLIEKIRPCIKQLMETCLEKNINVCIVTYFTQPWVIQEMIQKTFVDADRILIQANTSAFREKHNYEFLGKEAHIAAILTELYRRERLKIRPEEIILFDDDKDNTDIALKFGHMAYLVRENISEQSLEEFGRMIDTSDFRKSWHR